MGKIFGKVEVYKKPKKKKNEHNRIRNTIVNFRVSPMEKQILDARISATGMRKQDYYRQSCFYQKILVRGNIRSFSAIKDSLQDLAEKIDRNPDLTKLEPEDAERLKTILEIMDHLYGKQSVGATGLRQASRPCTQGRRMSGGSPNPLH